MLEKNVKTVSWGKGRGVRPSIILEKRIKNA